MQLNRDLEQETLVVLRKNGANGVYVSELANVLGINKMRATTVLDIITSKGLARCRVAGRMKLYFLIEKARHSP